jgi:hypothetical protein
MDGAWFRFFLPQIKRFDIQGDIPEFGIDLQVI